VLAASFTFWLIPGSRRSRPHVPTAGTPSPLLDATALRAVQIPSLKHGNGSIIVWARFAELLGQGGLKIISLIIPVLTKDMRQSAALTYHP